MVETPIDLAIVDFDSASATAARLVSTLRGRSERESPPIVVLSQLERDRARAVSLGADEALTNPPVPGELQSAVIHCLSRPRAWVTRPND
jgi:DNA-binding response OmpR family regulator